MSVNCGRTSQEIRAAELQSELETKYPDLTVTCAGPKIYIRGAFPVLHEGKVLDRYQIKIEWSDSDTEAPILYETGGRIPRINERHMGTDGKACSFVPEEWLLRPRKNRTITHYLDGPVRDYFIWQSLFDRGQTAPWGQRSHHVAGLIECYGEMVGMMGEQAIRRSLEYIAAKKFKAHWACPCGSGKPLRYCHLEHFRNLKIKIPRNIARLALQRLNEPTRR